jgi:hypothetical protein
MPLPRLSSCLGLALLALIISGCSRQSPTGVTEGPTTPPESAPNPAVGKPLKNPYGYQSYTDCEWVSGWAWDRDQPDAVVEVDIYDGSVLLGTTRADQFRQYLHDTGVGTAKYGFDFLLPTSLRDGKPHSIRVRIHGTNIDLVDTPKTITCPPDRRPTSTGTRAK